MIYHALRHIASKKALKNCKLTYSTISILSKDMINDKDS